MDDQILLALEVAERAAQNKDDFEAAQQCSLYLLDQLEANCKLLKGSVIILGLVMAVLAIMDTKKMQLQRPH